jgi:hypothetical protein
MVRPRRTSTESSRPDGVTSRDGLTMVEAELAVDMVNLFRGLVGKEMGYCSMLFAGKARKSGVASCRFESMY